MVTSQTGVAGVLAVNVVVLVARREEDLALILHHEEKERPALELLLKQNPVTSHCLVLVRRIFNFFNARNAKPKVVEKLFFL